VNTERACVKAEADQLPVTVMLPVENILRHAFGDFNRYVTPGCSSGS